MTTQMNKTILLTRNSHTFHVAKLTEKTSLDFLKAQHQQHHLKGRSKEAHPKHLSLGRNACKLWNASCFLQDDINAISWCCHPPVSLQPSAIFCSSVVSKPTSGAWLALPNIGCSASSTMWPGKVQCKQMHLLIGSPMLYAIKKGCV